MLLSLHILFINYLLDRSPTGVRVGKLLVPFFSGLMFLCLLQLFSSDTACEWGSWLFTRAIVKWGRVRKTRPREVPARAWTCLETRATHAEKAHIVFFWDVVGANGTVVQESPQFPPLFPTSGMGCHPAISLTVCSTQCVVPT